MSSEPFDIPHVEARAGLAGASGAVRPDPEPAPDENAEPDGEG